MPTIHEMSTALARNDRLLAWGASHWRLMVKLIASLGSSFLAVFLIRLYQHRKKWKAMGLPGPPHSFWLGHLQVMKDLGEKHAGKHLDYAAEEAATLYGQGLVFLDLWPFALPICLVSDPEVADQIVRADNLPKCLSAMTVHFPIFGEESLALAASDDKGENHWRTVRKAIAPGFKKGHLERSWTEDVVDIGEEFVAKLAACVDTKVPAVMAEFLVDSTLDLILRVTIGSRDRQLGKDILATLNSQLDHASATGVRNALARINPLSRYGEWKRTKAMYDLLEPTIRAHIKASQTEDISLKQKKDVLDWALSQHPDFTISTLVDQVKTFVLAGHDTASSTLAWIYYHLSQSPEVLQKLREEHTRIFDVQDLEHQSTIGKECDIIMADPSILNELHYTLAVMREALRLYPPASAVRQADSDIYIVEHKGQKFSIAGCMLWVNHWCLHRSEDTWGPDTAEFKPERWLDESGKMMPAPLAWQPFSKGPKNCIGMEFGILEQKILLAMTIRKFDFVYAGKEEPYQIFRLTAQPHNGIPLHMKIASKK